MAFNLLKRIVTSSDTSSRLVFITSLIMLKCNFLIDVKIVLASSKFSKALFAPLNRLLVVLPNAETTTAIFLL